MKCIIDHIVQKIIACYCLEKGRF